MKRLRLVPLLVALASSSFAQPRATEVTMQTMTGEIHGTLIVPEGDGPHPAVLLIAGSGPTDRDGNSKALPGRNDSLKMIASALADNGIASLRYDKRGIGASAAAGAKEEDLRFETYVADAKMWVRRLKDDPRFSSVTIAGHSEGSLIGLLAAGDADGFVSIAGASAILPRRTHERNQGIDPGVGRSRTFVEQEGERHAGNRQSRDRRCFVRSSQLEEASHCAIRHEKVRVTCQPFDTHAD